MTVVHRLPHLCCLVSRQTYCAGLPLPVEVQVKGRAQERRLVECVHVFAPCCYLTHFVSKLSVKTLDDNPRGASITARQWGYYISSGSEHPLNSLTLALASSSRKSSVHIHRFELPAEKRCRSARRSVGVCKCFHKTATASSAEGRWADFVIRVSPTLSLL